jgi:hypothetical protein
MDDAILLRGCHGLLDVFYAAVLQTITSSTSMISSPLAFPPATPYSHIAQRNIHQPTNGAPFVTVVCHYDRALKSIHWLPHAFYNRPLCTYLQRDGS